MNIFSAYKLVACEGDFMLTFVGCLIWLYTFTTQIIHLKSTLAVVFVLLDIIQT